MSTALRCDVCGGQIVIIAIKALHRLEIDAYCLKNHKKHLELPLKDLNRWLPHLTPLFFKCVLCDQPTTFNPVNKGGLMEIRVTCPNHGRRVTRSAPLGIYDLLIQYRNRPKEGAYCHICKLPANFIPEYSRYYCYQCQQYTKIVPTTSAPTVPSPMQAPLNSPTSAEIKPEIKLKEKEEDLVKITRKLDVLKDRFQFFVRVDNISPYTAINKVSVHMILPDSLNVATGKTEIARLGTIKPQGFGTAKFIIECGEFCKAGDQIHATVHFYDRIGELRIARMKSYPLDRCIYTERVELLDMEITQLKANEPKTVTFDIADISSEEVQQVFEQNLNLKPKLIDENNIEFMGQTKNHEPLLIDTNITSKEISFDLYGEEVNQMGLAQVLICLKNEIQQVKAMQTQALQIQKKEVALQQEEVEMQKEEVKLQKEELKLQKQEVAMQKLELNLEQQQMRKISLLLEFETKDHCIPLIDPNSEIVSKGILSKKKYMNVICPLCEKHHQVLIEKKERSWLKWGKIILNGLLCGAAIISFLGYLPEIAEDIREIVGLVSDIDLKETIESFKEISSDEKEIAIEDIKKIYDEGKEVTEFLKDLNQRTEKINEIIKRQDVNLKDLFDILNRQEIEALQNVFQQDQKFYEYIESEYGLYVHKTCYKEHRQKKKEALAQLSTDDLFTLAKNLHEEAPASAEVQTQLSTDDLLKLIDDHPEDVPASAPPEESLWGPEPSPIVSAPSEAIPIVSEPSEPIPIVSAPPEPLPIVSTPSEQTSPVSEPVPDKKSLDSIIAGLEEKIGTITPIHAEKAEIAQITQEEKTTNIPSAIEVLCPYCHAPLPEKKGRQIQQGMNDMCPKCFKLIQASSIKI